MYLYNKRGVHGICLLFNSPIVIYNSPFEMYRWTRPSTDLSWQRLSATVNQTLSMFQTNCHQRDSAGAAFVHERLAR